MEKLYEDQIEIVAFVFGHGNKVPTGTVVFRENNKTIGNARLDRNGVARLKIPQSKIGSGEHSIVAYYAGTKDFAASVSEAIVKLVK